MPDTGAPWNIPYVAGTDLVRDWPTDSQDLAEAIADGLDAAGNAGIGSNVVQTVKTDTFTTTSGSLTSVTGLSVSFTPTSDTSKVLVIAVVPFATSTASFAKISVFRDGTNLVVPTSPGNRSSVAGSNYVADPTSDMDRVLVPYTFMFLDSPATGSAVTYDVRVAADGSAYVNRAEDDTDSSNRFRSVATLTAIEVAA